MKNFLISTLLGAIAMLLLGGVIYLITFLDTVILVQVIMLVVSAYLIGEMVQAFMGWDL